MAHMSISQQISHATPTASGNGFKVFSINTNGASHDVIKYNHSALTKFVHQAEKYASKNGGDLPNTNFWKTTVANFRADKVLFRELHQCRELLALLKKNEIFDRSHTSTGGSTPITIPTTTPPLNQPQNIDANAVPEPASALLLGVGLVFTMVMGRRKAAGRAAAKPAV